MDEVKSLETLADEIVKHAKQADDHIIEAAMLIREARKRVEAGEAGGNWTAWAEKHIALGESRRRELQRIADAEDPRAELESIRAATRKRVTEFRERQKGLFSSVNPQNRRYETSVEPEGSDPRSGQDEASASEPGQEALPKRTAAQERAKFVNLGTTLIGEKPTIASFEKVPETPSEAGFVVLFAYVDTDGTTQVKGYITDKAVCDLALSAIGKVEQAEVSDADASSVSGTRNDAIEEAIEDARSKDKPELKAA